MPGIYGLSNKRCESISDAISAMTQEMLSYPHFIKDSEFVDQSTACSRVHLGTVGMLKSPLVDVRGNYVWIEGEAYNLADVILDLGWGGGESGNFDFPSSILNAYAYEQLDQFLSRIDGYFCAALYDSARKKIILISDRYGMRMLYWYHQNGCFAWSSEVKGLLALQHVDRTIDPSSLPCFMDLGYLMGGHTWFEHITLIKPATVIEYDIESDAANQHYYWKWGEIRASSLSFDDAVDALYEAFLASVKKRFNPGQRIGISLSGGLDSRAVFAAANKLYPDYRGYAYTFGIPDCDDIKIARSVVALSNWRHDEFLFDQSNWFEPRMKMVLDTDGMLDLTHMHGGEFLNKVSEQIDINLNGYLGDVVCGGGWMNPDYDDKRPSEASLQDFYNKYTELGYHSDEYFDIEKREPGLYMSRARRFTNMGTVNSLTHLHQQKPFFDNSLLELLLSLPSDYRRNNKIYSAMLAKCFPNYFRKIPWQKTGKPVGLYSKKKKSLILRAFNKGLVLAKYFAGVHVNHKYTNYEEWIRSEAIYLAIRNVLSSDGSERLYHEGRRWEDMYLIPHKYKKHNYANEILRAFTYEYYRKSLLMQNK